MPGIAFHRFVDATELKAEFTCSLCHLVLAHPLMASCCKAVFCDACIRPYVQSKKSCPADKKPLSVENNNNGNSSPRGGHRSSPSTSNGGNGSLVRPSSSLLRQLNCLKVKCTYAEVGCREVLPLETMLEVHEKQCTYGQAQVCPYCSFAVIQLTAASNDEQQQQQQQQQQQEQQDQQQNQQQQQEQQPEQQTDQQPPPPAQLQSVHVCQQSVAEYRESTGKELEEAAALLASLRLQLANYSRTVHELKLERTRAQNEASSHNNGGENSTGKPTVMNLERVVSNKELLTEARKYVNSAAVDGQKTAKEMVAKVVGLVKEALITRGDNIHAVARFIKEAMDCHYVGDWNVNLLWNSLGFAYYNFCPESYVEAKFGRVSIVVYKSFKSLGFNRVVNLYRAGALQDFAVSKSGFDDPTTKVIQKVVESALKTASDTVDFTEKVTGELMRKFGGIFHCLIYKVNFGFYCVRSEKSHFCLMTNSEAKILIFK